MELQLRNLGLKFKLDGGRYYVLEDFIVSEEGKKLSAEQVKMLRLLDIRNDEFKIKIMSYGTKEGEFKQVCTESLTGGEIVGEDEEME